MSRVIPVSSFPYGFTPRLKAVYLTLGFALLIALSAAPAGAAVHPGFRTYGIWQESTQTRLDVNVWYPVARTPSTVRYGEWVFKANRRAAPMEGVFPLVLISHGAAEDRFFHHNLAGKLAEQGFIVAAPTHPGDNTQDMDNLFTVQQITGRLQDYDTVISALKDDSYLGPHIDTLRIGLVGFGAGADAALLAVGGTISPQAWKKWKMDASPDAPYLNAWAQARLDDTVLSVELRQTQPNPILRSVVAVAPAYAMFFDQDGLAAATSPVLLMTATRDTLTPLQVAASLAPGSRLVSVGSEKALDFIARPEGELSAVLPGVVLPSAKRHAALGNTMIGETALFLLETIGTPQRAAQD